MAVKIRLKRMGKIRQPYYRIVVADSRKKRDGRVIEEIGKYHPKEDPSFIEVDSDRAQYWLGVGAQPSDPVAVLLKVTGDWQRFRGEAAPAPMKVAEARRDKTEAFNEALKDVQGQPKTEAVTPKRSTKKAAATPAAAAPPAESTETTEAPAAAPTETADAPASAPTETVAASAPVSTDTPEAPAAEATAPAEGPHGAGSAEPSDSGEAPSGFSIKGNNTSMKYHQPDGRWYDQTAAEVWFATPEAAEAAGYAEAGKATDDEKTGD